MSFLALPALLPTLSSNSLIITPSSNRVSPFPSPTKSPHSTIFKTGRILKPRFKNRTAFSEVRLEGKRLFDDEDGGACGSSINQQRYGDQPQPQLILEDDDDDDDNDKLRLV